MEDGFSFTKVFTWLMLAGSLFFAGSKPPTAHLVTARSPVANTWRENCKRWEGHMGNTQAAGAQVTLPTIPTSPQVLSLGPLLANTCEYQSAADGEEGMIGVLLEEWGHQVDDLT